VLVLVLVLVPKLRKVSPTGEHEQEQEQEQDSIRRRLFFIVAPGVSFEQSHEHADDSLEALFAGANLVRRRFRFGDENVQAGCAFNVVFLLRFLLLLVPMLRKAPPTFSSRYCFRATRRLSRH
jgi:hypothetical protein